MLETAESSPGPWGPDRMPTPGPGSCAARSTGNVAATESLPALGCDASSIKILAAVYSSFAPWGPPLPTVSAFAASYVFSYYKRGSGYRLFQGAPNVWAELAKEAQTTGFAHLRVAEGHGWLAVLEQGGAFAEEGDAPTLTVHATDRKTELPDSLARARKRAMLTWR